MRKSILLAQVLYSNPGIFLEKVAIYFFVIQQFKCISFWKELIFTVIDVSVCLFVLVFLALSRTLPSLTNYFPVFDLDCSNAYYFDLCGYETAEV